MSKTIHCCIDIRGVLRWKDRDLRGMFAYQNGQKLSGKEVREVLYDELAKGRKGIPMGEPCEGFSYDTGCPGHGQPEQA